MTTPEDPFQPPPPPPPYGAPPPPPPYAAPPAQWGAPPQAYQGQPGYGQPIQPLRGDYASWGLRVGATLIDGLISGVPGIILIVIGGAIGNGVGAGIVVLAYLGIIGFGIWNIVFRQGTTGQTIGKQQVGIRLLREIDGQVLGPGMTFVRQLAHILDSLACDIGYLWPLWDAKHQTFADKIMDTIVIKV